MAHQSRAALFIALAIALPLQARVTTLTITQREAPTYGGQIFGRVGQYERIVGTIAGELDPDDRRNTIIQDLKLAPRNARGRVEYVATFTLLKPIDMGKANGGLLYEVVNRGNKQLASFSVGGDFGNKFANAGDGFFEQQGYTILWSGWQGDVVPGGGRESIQVPVAHNADGSPVTGPVLGLFANVKGNTSQIIVFSAPIAYQPLTLDTTQAALTRSTPPSIDGAISGPVTTLGSDEWAWADCRTVEFPGTPDPTRVCLKNGFDPTQVYRLVYTAKDPLVLGIGAAATRDINAFFRYALQDDAGTANPLAQRIKFAVGHGTSQSGGFIRTFIHLGFNEDESGRLVFDGANAHISGRLTALNFRFANPDGAASLYSPGSEAALWWQSWPDTARQRMQAGILDRCTSTHTCPKIFETNGSAEFWDLRMSPGWVGTSATADIPLPRNVRRYYFPGTTHGGGVGGFSTNALQAAAGPGGQCVLSPNPNPEREQMRALFVALHDWVVKAREPPLSRYPLLRTGMLVPSAVVSQRFAAIPGAPLPADLQNPLLDYDFGPEFIYNDLSGVISRQPPAIKQVLPSLVPQVDADGNEMAGVKSPLAQAPLASYLGWNITASGAYRGQICSFSGGMIPFAKTRAERITTGDPRRSVEERYRTHAGYVKVVAKAARQLVRERYLLPDDARRLIAEAVAGNVLAPLP